MHKIIIKVSAFARIYWLSIFLCTVITSDAVYAQDNSDTEELWLAAQVNQFSAVETLLFLKQADGRLLISAQDWQQYWRLKPATSSLVHYQDQDYYYLDELQGVSYQLNNVELSIALTVDVSWFQSSVLSASSPNVLPSLQASTGAFVSYELASTYQSQQQTDTNLFLDSVVFNQHGVLENQFLVRHLEQQRHVTRLNTSLIKEDVAQLSTLTIGDTVTSSLGLANSVRFAGVQWASNFALQPLMSKLPLPQMKGQVLLPATVDIFINDIKSVSQQVPAGDFVINDIPIVSGQGEARMVVKDLLGREQTVILPYYAGAELLKVGLQEYAVEAGFMREHYGEQSASYGSLLAVVSHRQGIFNNLTSEFQGQWQQQQQTIRYGAAFVIPQMGGAMQAWLANSWHHTQGAGHAQGLALSRQSAYLDIAATIQHQAQNFVQLGTEQATLKDSIRLLLSSPFKLYGAVSMQYSYGDYYSNRKEEWIQANYSLSLGRYGSIVASLGQELQPVKLKKAQLGFSIPLFNKKNLSITSQPYEQSERFTLQKSVPLGSGLGYALTAETGDLAQNQAAITWQTNRGTYRLRATEQNQHYGTDLSMMGSAAWLNKELFWARRIDNSFAVAQVADLPNINVYSNNQLIGQTNQQGKILIPRLQPYQKNMLRVDASDLPFDVEITSQEQEVVPAYRSGVVVEFPVKRSYGATLTLLSENGQPVPAGTFVTKQDAKEEFVVGYRGELYITGLSAKNVLTAVWKNQRCTFEVDFIAQANSLPDLGTHICRGISP